MSDPTRAAVPEHGGWMRTVERRRLTQRIGVLSFFDEFVPFAVLFTLWFDDNGATIGQISTAFFVWAIAAMVFEIPTGMLADRVDRRRLLGVAFGIRAAGTAAWLIWPSWTGLLIGAVLWAVHDAAAGGAWEALIHDQLVAIDAGDDYTVVMARTGQVSHLGLAAAALVASPLLAIGLPLEALGWVTCAVHLVTITLVMRLPDVRWVVDDSRRDAETSTEPSVGTWHAVRSALSDRTVVVLLVIGSLIGGLSILDEYIALVSRERGASDGVVPLLFLATWIGLIAGGEIAARRPGMTAKHISVFFTGGAVAALLALLVDPLWALAGFGITYAAIDTAWVIGDARLQRRVPAHLRATVTSARELGGGVVVAIALGSIGLLANGADPTPGLVLVACALIATGVLAARLPDD